MREQAIKKYWEEAQELSSDLQPTQQFSTPQLVIYLNEHLPPDCEEMTKTKVNYLRIQGILSPHESGEGEIRTSWRYTVDDVRRAILIELFKTREKLSVQESKYEFSRFESNQGKEVLIMQVAPQESLDSAPPTPKSSAYTLLRNRTLGTLLTALGGGTIEVAPPEWFIAIRSVKNIPEGPPIDMLTWTQVQSLLIKEIWSLAISDTFSKIYMYPGLPQLLDNRPKIRGALEDYTWYAVILQENAEQCYELLLGLPDEQSGAHPSNVAIQHSLAEFINSGLPLQLSSFPGISTLLKAAFINPRGDKEGTLLSVLVEIIAGASNTWDYCNILVPDFSSGTPPTSLKIQEYSSAFPKSLRERAIDIARSLSGWCYRYKQEAVVEPTAQNDSRLAFYEEEGRPTAAIAVPALTEEQRVVGVIYVARHRPIDEKEVVFTPELIASLKAFGYVCGDVIVRDQLEVETVRSMSRLTARPWLSSFSSLDALLQSVAAEVRRGVSPDQAAHSWLYLLALNIQTTSQDTITRWLCEQGLTLTGNFLAYRLWNPPLPYPLSIGYHKVKDDQYVFAVLQTLDLPEEKYKQAIIRLQQELDKMRIGWSTPDFSPSGMTFRFEELYQSFASTSVDRLIAELNARIRERLVAGPYFKRGHLAMYAANLDQAVSEFEDALRYVPNSWYGHKHLAEVRMLQGTNQTINQAIVSSKKAIALNSRYASAHCLLADCLAYKARFGEALVEYERALLLDSTRPDFLMRYGQTLAGMTPDEYQQAMAYALQHEGKSVDENSILKQPWQEAIDKFDRARNVSTLSAEPEKEREQRVEYHYQRGYAYLQANLISKAVEDFTVGRKLAPRDLRLSQAYSYALSLDRKEENTSAN